MDTEGTKDRILSAALDLFADYGFHGVSIRSITARVGIKESSLYNHYKHKEDIADHIYESFTEWFLGTPLSFENDLPEPISFDLVRQAVVDSYSSYFNAITGDSVCKMWKFLIAEQYHDERARKILHKVVSDWMVKCNHRLLRKMQALNLIEIVHPDDCSVLLYHYIIACLFDFLAAPGAERKKVLLSRLEKHITIFLMQVKK